MVQVPVFVFGFYGIGNLIRAKRAALYHACPDYFPHRANGELGSACYSVRAPENFRDDVGASMVPVHELRTPFQMAGESVLRHVIDQFPEPLQHLPDNAIVYLACIEHKDAADLCSNSLGLRAEQKRAAHFPEYAGLFGVVCPAEHYILKSRAVVAHRFLALAGAGSCNNFADRNLFSCHVYSLSAREFYNLSPHSGQRGWLAAE